MRLADDGGIVRSRKLNDGREFNVVKVFYEPDWLEDKLSRFGFDAPTKKSGNYFLYADGTKR